MMHRHIIIIGEQLLASAQAGGAFPPLPSGATATTIHVVAFPAGGGRTPAASICDSPMATLVLSPA